MTTAILQARMGSQRLPGKVLRKIIGKPMLELQLERIRQASSITKIVVATSVHAVDNPVAEICSELEVECFRGSLEDVLDRYYKAALAFEANQIVRLTGDCPLCDPDVIDRVVQFHLDGDYDYTSNVIKLTYPDGLDVEVFSRSALETAWCKAELPSHREHVTFYFLKNPDQFKLGSVENAKDLSSLRWTVDYEEDFMLATEIFERLYKTKSCFRMDDIVELINSDQGLAMLNAKHNYGEGWITSFEKDKKWCKGEGKTR